MEHLTWLDWLIVIGYLGAIILFGAYFGRGQNTARDYFLGGRNIPWWGVGLSIVATETSALTFIGIPAQAYGGNMTFLQIVLGYIIARILLALFLVPHYFRSEIYSPYALFARRGGEPARKTAAAVFLVAGTLAAGVRVYVTCLPLQLMLGLARSEIIWAVFLFVGLSLIYTYLGGIKAVVWTDAVQFALFVGGGIFVLFYGWSLLEGTGAEVVAMAHEAGKFQWLRTELSLDLPYNLWMGLIGATFMACATHGVDQLIVQRVLTCRDVREGRKSLLLSAVIILPLFLLFLLVGIVLWLYYQQHSFLIPLPENQADIAQNQYVFPIFILTVLPPVVKGVLVVGILSAAMSSVSSALSALASVSTMDFMRTRLSEGDTISQMRWGRFSTVGWGVMLVVVAYLCQQTTSILDLAFALTGLTSGAMLGGILVVLGCREVRPALLVVGMGLSFLVVSALHFLPKIGAGNVWDRWIGIEVGWPWYTLVGTLITVMIGTSHRWGVLAWVGCSTRKSRGAVDSTSLTE